MRGCSFTSPGIGGPNTMYQRWCQPALQAPGQDLDWADPRRFVFRRSQLLIRLRPGGPSRSRPEERVVEGQAVHLAWSLAPQPLEARRSSHPQFCHLHDGEA